MVNRTIRKLLLKRLNITPQALSQRAQKLKATYGPMTTKEAVYVIAHQHGIDLSRFLTIETIDRIRSLVPRELPKVPKPEIAAKTKKVKVAQVKSYPLVTDTMVSKSVLIGKESFPQIFVLENSIRQLIIKKLSGTYGKDWWLKARIKDVREKVQRTIDKEKKYPYRERRGTHPIYYSNFADLKQVILNERNLFVDVIPDLQWFGVQMDQVYMARNPLAHSIPLTEDDASRIRLLYRDWARLLENANYK
ncbi:MAG: Swt1 family HEPN domain-containing protein [candidate division Zixibacteria bacterium]|nr:Swt1 family HEPN domain-containing protein [candidate division Zixibacteria bacterium]